MVRFTIQSAEKHGKIEARKCIVSKSTEQVLSLALLPLLGKKEKKKKGPVNCSFLIFNSELPCILSLLKDEHICVQ